MGGVTDVVNHFRPSELVVKHHCSTMIVNDFGIRYDGIAHIELDTRIIVENDCMMRIIQACPHLDTLVASMATAAKPTSSLVLPTTLNHLDINVYSRFNDSKLAITAENCVEARIMANVIVDLKGMACVDILSLHMHTIHALPTIRALPATVSELSIMLFGIAGTPIDLEPMQALSRLRMLTLVCSEASQIVFKSSLQTLTAFVLICRNADPDANDMFFSHNVPAATVVVLPQATMFAQAGMLWDVYWAGEIEGVEHVMYVHPRSDALITQTVYNELHCVHGAVSADQSRSE